MDDIENGSAKPPGVLEAIQEQKEIRTLAASDSSIRVDVGLLDKLMNLVGELVLARNQILQFSTTQQDPVFLGTSQRLNLITTELQEGVMKTRMQPIGNIWSRGGDGRGQDQHRKDWRGGGHPKPKRQRHHVQDQNPLVTLLGG